MQSFGTSRMDQYVVSIYTNTLCDSAQSCVIVSVVKCSDVVLLYNEKESYLSELWLDYED